MAKYGKFDSARYPMTTDISSDATPSYSDDYKPSMQAVLGVFDGDMYGQNMQAEGSRLY